MVHADVVAEQSSRLPVPTQHRWVVQVLASDYEAQKAVGPFLENPVLRRIIQTFTNDTDGDFSKWANNKQVLAMLAQAKRLMDEGHITPAEMESHLLQHLQVPKCQPLLTTFPPLPCSVQ